uniref:NADH-ubiquinone oxidoreductase chain 3 n=1 Tax=Chaetopleura apiculata TaxID=58794 RepID=A0A343S5A9_CHAAP|nr:NADH dehydrogenase subunit 3 [Chaetopleura apiculata]
MMLLCLIMLFIFFLSGLLVIISVFLTKKKLISREKSSPFECGFDPKSSSRIPFSMRFFLITVIFLVFDVEIILLLPYLMTCSRSTDIFSLVGSVSIIIILLGGMLHEWAQGSLYWMDYKE